MMGAASHLRLYSLRLKVDAGVLESLGLVLASAVLLGLVAANAAVNPIWQSNEPPHAPWCPPDVTPAFQFGFAELARQLAGVMGEPTECEHGSDWTGDTRQQTTTGVAVYRWCTNTPSFTREQEVWMLTPGGMQYWTGQGDPPPAQLVVRAPDVRRPCQP
jgi:hypothetical protein